jgi:uncharacterized protein YjbI with pentapeptide repeats
MKFEIKHHITGSLLFECEALSLKIAVELAVSKGASLRGADLRGADLDGASLRGADLDGADLRGASLDGASLRGAYLDGADLRGASLRGADLDGADLRGADLREIKKDFFDKLLKLKDEAIYLYKSVVDGKINGSVYEGECACFCGTLANSKKITVKDLEGFGIIADADSPIERWFMAIRKGDTPESNPVSSIVKDWLEEFMKANEIKLPKREIVWNES